MTSKEQLRYQRMKEQNYRCYYCEQEFWSHVFYKHKLVYLVPHIEHMIPKSKYKYPNDAAHNIVVSCHICNCTKRNRIFKNVKQLKQFLLDNWLTHGEQECKNHAKKIKRTLTRKNGTDLFCSTSEI